MDVGAFADWLQEELDRRDMTQGQLARAADLTPAFISLLVNMKREPSKDTLASIARALGFRPEFLFYKVGLIQSDIDSVKNDTLAMQIATAMAKLSERDRQMIANLVQWMLDNDGS